VARPGNVAAWGSLLTGLASIATLPLAIYLTRYSERYELLHAGLAIPLGGALGVASVMLGARARRRAAVRLERGSRGGAASVGRALGVVGVCLALAGAVALAVYGLLEYAGTRD